MLQQQQQQIAATTTSDGHRNDRTWQHQNEFMLFENRPAAAGQQQVEGRGVVAMDTRTCMLTAAVVRKYCMGPPCRGTQHAVMLASKQHSCKEQLAKRSLEHLSMRMFAVKLRVRAIAPPLCPNQPYLPRLKLR